MGYAKRGNAASMRAIDCFHRLAKTFPKTDRVEQIFNGEKIDLVFKVSRASNRSFFNGQKIDLVLMLSRAANRSLCCKTERYQTISEKPRQRRRQIHAHHEDIARAMNPLRKVHRTIRRKSG